jgi:cytochrome c peroxidase
MDTARLNGAAGLRTVCILIALGWGGPAPAQAPDLTAAKRDSRRPPPLAVANPALATLGRQLFFDPLISASGKTACASCHAPELGWVSRMRIRRTIPASRAGASRSR